LLRWITTAVDSVIVVLVGQTLGLLTIVVGGYLITQKDVFLDRARACQLIAAMLSGRETSLKIDLPPPAIIKVSLWHEHKPKLLK
jgi:hypothetical protein